MADPKPPAASGDRWLELAEQLWHGSPDEPTTVEAARIAFLPHWADALEAAATEAQLRVLEQLVGRTLIRTDPQASRVLDEMRAHIMTKGPL